MLFRLHFHSCTLSGYGDRLPFSITVEARSLRDASLIGERLRGEPTWVFQNAEPISDSP